MRKHFAIALALIIAGASLAQGITRTSGNEDSASPTIGSTIANFQLPDANGADQSLTSLKGKNGTVIVFLSTRCPVVKAYIERIEKLAEDYRAQGVNVIGINSNSTESNDEVKAHASENRLSFPVLLDKGNKIADRLGALVTPEAFFLDASNKLVYRGRIDNSRDPANIASNDLREAINATLAGKPVAKSEASAFGCSIKRVS